MSTNSRINIFLHMSKKYLLRFLICVFIAGIIVSSCYDEIEIQTIETDSFIKFDKIYCGIDFNRGLILVPVQKESMADFRPVLQTNYSEVKIGNKNYSSGDRMDFSSFKLSDSIFISFKTEVEEYFDGYIYFTTLPVIAISCSDEIPREMKIPCEIITSDYFHNSEGSNNVLNAGIEIRGRSTSWRPKKSYSFHIWQSSTDSTKKDVSLFGMRNDDDWILDAMNIDEARMRNKVSMGLWGDICFDSENEFIHGKPYIESQFVELFIDFEYLGLFCLTERIDRKQLDLNISDTKFDGLLYKADFFSNTTRFINLPDTNSSQSWDGWEQVYPDPALLSYWQPIYDFSDFVMNSKDTEFKEQISNFLNLDNLIDYYIFINTCNAFDNMEANMFYARKNANSTFIIYPWDLDATWGRNWDSKLLPSDLILTNKYFDRLIELDVDKFRKRVQERWNELRKNIITYSNLTYRFTNNFMIITESGAYEREVSRWPDKELDIYSEMDYIYSWIASRLDFLDSYFLNLEK